MQKPKGRRKRNNLGKSEPRGLSRGAHDHGLCAEFQKRFAEGGTVKEHAQDLGIPKTTAYRWAFTVKLAAADWLRREGWGEAKLIQEWIAQARRSRGHVLNGALREIGSILDIYPAKKPPQPAQPPVNVTFCTNLDAYKDLDAAPRQDGKALMVEGQQDEDDPLIGSP